MTEQKFEPGKAQTRVPPSQRPRYVAPAAPATPPTAAQIAQAEAGNPQLPAESPPAFNSANPIAVRAAAPRLAPRAPLAASPASSTSGLGASHRSVYSNGKAARAQREVRAQRSRPGVGQHMPRSAQTRQTLGVKR